MSLPTCSLSILAARTDLSFMKHTIPHLLRMNHSPFQERVLAIDTAPLSGEKAYRPGIGTLEELRECAHQFLQQGIIDRVLEIEYSPDYRDYIYQKHFGHKLRETHAEAGCPIYPYLFCLEKSESDYLLQYDSDMLLYQNKDFDWVEESINIMEKYPDILTMRPLTGPPREDGKLYQPIPYEIYPDGFYKLKSFSSRMYLINRKQFDQILPLPLIWQPYRNSFMNRLPNTWKTALNYFTGKGSLGKWEDMVSQKILRTKFYRGILAQPQAWTLHPKDRSPEFLAALPSIIERIEKGEYPPEQGGYYDLILDAWLKSELLV